MVVYLQPVGGLDVIVVTDPRDRRLSHFFLFELGKNAIFHVINTR
jgi:hypothetical protein